MKTNRWIESSQRLYRHLLRLYPQAYRTTYEEEMFRFFTSQCREAYQQRGRLGILLLWLRTFVDVGKTVVIEHLSDPNAKAGLLEATPNTPLPWKGVFLVLIPGLVFFVSQIAQVTTDKDWFFYVYYRAAFFLIAPVLLVWILTRRFPIWGLVPLGLLFGTLQKSYSPGYLLRKIPFLTHSEVMWKVFGFALDPYYIVPISVCLAFLCILIWYAVRSRRFSMPVWLWLAVYMALIIFQLLVVIQREYSQNVADGFDWRYIKLFIAQVPLLYLYNSLPFLLLVFIGYLFVHRHRGLSFLLLLGYLLPTIVIGRYGEGIDGLPFSAVVLAVLVYRIIVALVAPIWLTRAVSFPGQRRAAAIPIAMAVFCHMSLNIILNLALANQYTYQLSLLDYVSSIWNQLIVVFGIALAVQLYFPVQKENAISLPPAAVTG
ncbi:MAG: hypothetical protein QM730_03755 [Anaerolineales bacterium]